MKWVKLISVICFISIALSGKSQNSQPVLSQSSTSHIFRDASFSVSPNVLFNTPNGIQFAGGFKLRMFVGKRFSFNSDIVFSRNYVHFGPGIIGIPAWLIAFNPNEETEDHTLSELLGIGLIMIMSVEHTAYNIPVKNNTDISPYISILRFKDSYEFENNGNSGDSRQQVDFVAGLEVNKYFRRFLLSPYIEYHIGYNDHIQGLNSGVYFGYYFPVKQ